MNNAMFSQIASSTVKNLLSTTVTYAVDLSETEFLHLKPIVPIEQLGIRPAEFRLYEVADTILERYAINELHYLASVNADIARVQNLKEVILDILFGVGYNYCWSVWGQAFWVLFSKHSISKALAVGWHLPALAKGLPSHPPFFWKKIVALDDTVSSPLANR